MPPYQRVHVVPLILKHNKGGDRRERHLHAVEKARDGDSFATTPSARKGSSSSEVHEFPKEFGVWVGTPVRAW